MKKIFNFIIIVWLLISSFIIAKTALVLELPSNQDIQISVSAIEDQEEILQHILNSCETYEVDIYKSEYLGMKEHKNLYKIYYSDMSRNNLLSSLTIMNGKSDGKEVISTRYNSETPYIKSFNLNNDYEFHNLKLSMNDTKIDGVYKVLNNDKTKVSEFMKELKSKGITVDEIGTGTSSATNEYTELYVFFIIITMLISFYLIIQNQKNYSIKKLNGYSNRSIIIENNINLIKKIILFTLSVSIIDIIILIFIKEYDSMLEYIGLYYAIQGVCMLITLVINNIANIYLLKIHPVSGIKNFSKDIIIDLSNMIVKIATITMITLYLLSLVSTFTELNKISSNVVNWEKTKSYAYTITQGYYPSGIEEVKRFENKFKNLYIDLKNEKSAILLDSSSYGSNIPRSNRIDSWSYDNSKIIINKNYVKLNDLPDEIQKGIQTCNIEDTLILIPTVFKSETDKIKEDFFKNLPLNHDNIERIKIITYDDNISIFTANTEVNALGSEVDSPIIVLDDNNFDDSYYLSAFSAGSIFIPVYNQSSPYSEIKNNLAQSELDNTIKITPLVYSRYGEKISEYQEEIAKSTLQLSLLIVVGITLIYNSITIYFTKNNKEIALKKMIGYGPFEIYQNYYKDIVFILLIAGFCCYLYVNSYTFIYLLLIFFAFELSLTNILLIILGRKNILSMLKGNN